MRPGRVPTRDTPTRGPGGRGRRGELPGPDRLTEAAELLADCAIRRLPVGYCAVYLYDRPRSHLVKIAARGPEPEPPLPGALALGDGVPLPAFDRTSFSLPLWDGRSTLGMIYGRMAAGAPVTPDTLERGRIVAQSWAVTISYTLEDGDYTIRAGAKPAVLAVPRPPHEGANDHLAAYLESALGKTCPDGPVSVAEVRLLSAEGRVDLPRWGIPLRAGACGSGHAGGRAFGLAAEGRAVIVWLGAPEDLVRRKLQDTASAGGRLGDLLEGTGPRDRWTEARIDAIGLAVYPRDARTQDALLAMADDFHDLELCLTAFGQTPDCGERGADVSNGTADQTVQVMDRLVLDREIDRQKQVLAQAIKDGRNFQDNEVREISESLDRLIIVRQRHMGHRGAVPAR